MIVKLIHSMAGSRFSFLPRQIIQCSEKTGASLVTNGIAEEAPKGAVSEGTLHDDIPAEELEGPPAGKKRFPPPEKKGKETATMKAPEKAVTGGTADGICTGTTRKGNPCLRAAIEGTDRCYAHPREE